MGHLATLYSRAYINQLKLELADMRERGLDDVAQGVLSRGKYLSEGAAIGSKSFIQALYAQYRENFGASRKRAAKPLGEGFTDLYSLQGKVNIAPAAPPSSSKKE